MVVSDFEALWSPYSQPWAAEQGVSVPMSAQVGWAALGAAPDYLIFR